MPDKDFRLVAQTSALVVVDMQNDFLDPDGYFAQRSLDVGPLRQVIEPTARLREALPPAVRTVFTAQVYEPDGSDDLNLVHRLKPARLVRSGAGAPVQRGSWGARVIDRLAPGPADRVVEKRRFDAFYRTDLERLLRTWGIDTLIFAGVVADVCVETTVRSAYVRDFDVVWAIDCVGAWTAEDLRRSREAIEAHFGVARSGAEILAALGPAGGALAQ